MITDNQTNFVYLAGCLKEKHPEFHERLVKVLDDNDVKHDFLPNTRDIWARDYMPIQVSEDKFIEYRYDPDYLLDIDERKTKTYPDLVSEKLTIKPHKTDIILDGGNVTKAKDAVFLVDKAIEENKPFYTQKQLENELRNLFEVDKIFWLPWTDELDDLGHADGLIRIIDDETLLVQGYMEELPDYPEFIKGLRKSGYKIEVLECSSKNSETTWPYLNYLQTEDFILVPAIGRKEDDRAFEQLSKIFHEYSAKGRIKQVLMKEIVKKDGALNCITWTIKSNKNILKDANANNQ